MSPLPSLGLGVAGRVKQGLRAVVARPVRLGVPTVAPRVVRALPHDPEAFTQGLTFWEGQLYESTGGHHRSSLRVIDPHDGSVRRMVSVHGDFAEGIAIVGEKLYQLAWRSGTARVYRLPDLTLIDQLRYPGEGWGLAARDGQFMMSDGTSLVSFRDASFGLLRTLRINSHGIPVRRLNDLEYVGRSIYANQWPTADILELSADSGRVLRVVDCSALAAAVRPKDYESALNGIAYNPERGTFFLTGKNWQLMFEVEIPLSDDVRAVGCCSNGEAVALEPRAQPGAARGGELVIGPIGDRGMRRNSRINR